ncbi:hypothetical protein FD755_015599 [Muntiacus reevesi]|uniref:DZF domain-containing protein n=1 Tax=Muntiacus reevesi TaxID=9886 RepID=A0A5N3XHX2_MUNRE|nr:hypothetical protein FD755_015599 [Muntiacus reevesi]
MLPQKMCPMGTFVNNDHHVMAEHPSIYPIQEDMEAVQNMVSHREWTLKVMSHWITEQEESNGNHAESENVDVPKKDENEVAREQRTKHMTRTLRGVML